MTQYPTAVPADPAPPDQPLPGGAASTDDASPYTTVLAGAAPHVQAQAMKNGLLPLPTTAAAGFTHGVCRGKFTFHNKPAQRSGYSLYWGHEVKCYNTGEVLFGQGQAVLQTPAGSTDQAGVNYAGHVGTFGTSNNVYSEAKRYSHQIDWHGSQTLLNGDDWVVVPLQCFGQFTSTISCHFTSPVFR